MAPEFADAFPTKDLFIDFLTKDLSLSRAITDLVDNCIDGARRLRADGGDYHGLFVHLKLSRESFEIVDNCGGIPVDIARQYAFRFGRPTEMVNTPHSVGQFGVGMKRALFKLGKSFTVSSVAESSRFVLPVNVDTWRAQQEWRFEFAEVEEHLSVAPDERGTRILVGQLNANVSSEFERENFKIRLANEVQSAHQESIRTGMTITVNEVALEATTVRLRDSANVETGYRFLQYGSGVQKVSVRIYAGVGESAPQAAGWYVFCNGRLLLESDQTLVTGWGEAGETRVPMYHNQYAAFRGLVYLDCYDTTQLPWNTTKTGVDTESRLYRTVRENMVLSMRPVIDFLNDLDREKASPAEDRPLARAFETAPLVTRHSITVTRPFKAVVKRTLQPSGPRMQRIQYDRPIAEVESVQESLGVSTFKEVGEQTFDYYYRLECKE
jgi:hypothetical protein